MQNQQRDLYALPGGRVERGETPEQAMVREVREELGLRVKAATKIGTYQSRHANHHLFRVDRAVGEISIDAMDNIREVLGLGFINAGRERQIPIDRMQGHVQYLVRELMGKVPGLQKEWPRGKDPKYILDNVWFNGGHKCFYSWDEQLEILRRGGNFCYRGPEPYFH